MKRAMDSCHQIPLLPLVFFLLNFSISDVVAGVSGRSLLQVKKDCPINIEYLNYTIITSQCRGPDYPPGPCCSSLTELACPIAGELNDLSNSCAESFFSYLTRVGKYPPGLFSGVCRGDKEGLPCPVTVPPPSSSPNANAATRLRLLLGWQIFATLLLLLLLPLQSVDSLTSAAFAVSMGI